MIIAEWNEDWIDDECYNDSLSERALPSHEVEEFTHRDLRNANQFYGIKAN